MLPSPCLDSVLGVLPASLLIILKMQNGLKAQAFGGRGGQRPGERSDYPWAEDQTANTDTAHLPSRLGSMSATAVYGYKRPLRPLH